MSLLVLMGGLPGVGKSAIADALGERLPATVISVDEIEAAMLRSGIERSFETGLAAYNAGATTAAHQLRLGLAVIADAANYLEVGRQIWCAAAERADADIRAPRGGVQRRDRAPRATREPSPWVRAVP